MNAMYPTLVNNLKSKHLLRFCITCWKYTIAVYTIFDENNLSNSEYKWALNVYDLRNF